MWRKVLQVRVTGTPDDVLRARKTASDSLYTLSEWSEVAEGLPQIVEGLSDVVEELHQVAEGLSEVVSDMR